MKSSGTTFRKHSSAGVDWASWFLGIGLGLTLALQATTMRKSDISTVYAVVASVSRLAALMVDGVDAEKWIGRAELADYSFWTINRQDGTAWSYGFNKGY